MDRAQRAPLVVGFFLILFGILALAGQFIPGLWGWIGPRLLADGLVLAIALVTVAAARRLWIRRGHLENAGATSRSLPAR